jgi:hypothetical protein
MNMCGGMAAGAAIAWLVLFGGPAPGFAASLQGRLSGAWTTSQADCKKIFVRNGGALAYRQPVDKFAQAVIITPSTIYLPSQTCQIRSVSHVGGVDKLEFDCRDSISYTSQSVEIEVKSVTEMVYRPNGDKTLDTAMVRCSM